MKTSHHIEILARQGESMAKAAAAAGLTATVPTCPGWQVADLLRHTGQIHRWAAAFVREELTSFQRRPSAPDGDTDLISWFGAGHAALVATLKAAPSDLACWTFMPAPSPLAFWARRQAHETTIHRMDAESARGTQADGVGAELAVDGIDELLAGFHQRSVSKVRTDTPRVLRVRATDTGDTWTVRLSSEAPVTERGSTTAEAECELAGPATELYAALWNRRPVPTVTGDHALAELWKERSRIV
ncbi:maleylpyruvate isomerase family mycothiol-dependent enzyme [Streptomyces sp. TS71-3]|uniref:maleylpyruvate isomerase family mycothiol-dependent enzyme n=1 Tax=Streptomyces sp. TS71-3 TaxID=2733862 RepID=UPI001BB3BE2C|nr:maleylpyruvate isomerase family mycothiol-dependent enzyme [Streptomyces sp. TS71-3]